jgi:uncharacterized GH25 family protein
MVKITTIFLLLALCIAGAEAHDTWLSSTCGWVSQEDLALVQMTEGHSFVPMGPPPGDISLKVIAPDGSEETFVVDESTNTNGPYYRFDFGVDDLGLYVAAGEQHEGALTFVHTSFGASDEEMEGYDEIDWDGIDSSGWDSDWYIAEAYQDMVKYSKVFLVVENSNFASASVPIGQKLEIVPLDNITTLGTGDFKFQVLFDGEPAEGLDVSLATTGEHSVAEGETDEKGEVTLEIPEPGFWVVKTEYKDGEMAVLPQHGPDAVDESFVGTGYFSILTLRSDYIKPEAD